MNNPSTYINEDFLAECTTNVFSLTDTRGLRWKKYACSCLNSTSTSDDPILKTYAVALKTDVLCVWQRIPQTSVPPEETGKCLFNCAKELVIFWYGEEPVIKDVPGPFLQEVEAGSYEDGISAQNLDLFFKSIHNIIEKNLLNGDFVRLGKWFTKPVDSRDKTNTLAKVLAFSFSLFIHGGSTVVAAVDVEEKDAVRNICATDIHKTSVHMPCKESKVLLAPYGLDAHLTGNSLPDSDGRSVKIIEEWKKFFPVGKKEGSSSIKSNSCCSVVEVILGDVKMLYPSKLVLVPVTNGSFQTELNASCTDACAPSKISTKVINKSWENIKLKEELHLPSTQLWDFKENCYHSSCGCSSNSNTTRVKSSNTSNPFSNTFVHAQTQNTNNMSSNTKLKRSNQTMFASFHQRTQKAGKPLLKSSPSLSGRITPSISSSNKISGSHGSTTFEEQQRSIDKLPPNQDSNSLKNTNKLYSCLSSNIPVPALSKREKASPSATEMKTEIEKKTSVYNLPTKLSIKRPILPPNVLEPRVNVPPLETVQNAIPVEFENGVLTPVFVDEPNEMKIERVASQGLKRNNDSVSGLDEVLLKKLKPELNDPPKRGPGRPRGRRSSVLSPVEGIGPTSDDDIFLPNTRRRSSVNLRKRDSPITSPRSDSPTHSGPGRPRKRTRVGSKTPNTAKSDSQVFNFGPNKCPPSPPYKSTSSVSIMTTKELMPNFDDLDHMFDNPDDDDNSIKKMPAITDCVVIASLEDVHLTTSNLTITTAAGLTAQDLAQMFPTPPSPPKNTTSPITMINNESLSTHSLHNMSLLSPDTLQHTSTLENDTLDENVGEKSPMNGVLQTFAPPKFQIQPIPFAYAPISLPGRKVNLKNVKHLKYTPSWDVSHHPPILSRRPSGIRVTTTAGNSEIQAANQSDLKLYRTSPTVLLQQQISELANPGTSSISLTIQDYQSLVINLTLADSSMNWVSSEALLSSVVQEKTYIRFNIYQNFVWKKHAVKGISSNLFLKDTALHSSTSIQHISKPGNTTEPNFILLPDSMELLIKNISTPLAAKYLHHIITKYYTKKHKSMTSVSTEKLLHQCNIILKELQPRLEQALHNPARKSLWDNPKVHGPLSFKKLDDICNKNGMRSSLSSNSLLFNYDGDMLSTSASAVKHWQTMHLEPYGGQRNIAYLVALPESEYIVSSTKQFFKELNSVYESLNLGTHNPIVKDLRDGLLRITQKSVQKVSASTVNNWFSQNDSKLMAKLKVVAQFCKHQLGPYLASLTLDATLYTNKSEIERSASSAAISAALKPQNPSSPSGSTAAGFSYSSQSSTSINTSATATVYDETPVDSTKVSPPTLVIYMVDPFHCETQEENVPRLWSYIGLMKCFVEMSPNFDKLKDNIILQVIPMEQILQLNLNARSDNNGTRNPELKKLALSVYSRCRANSMTWLKKTVKCMTGFGMCNYRDNLIRRRQVENNLPPYVYMPPYIISLPARYIKNDTHSATAKTALQLKESDVNILFCCYGVSIDNQWLLVTCTDEVGELNESNVIRITYPQRKKSWSFALKKLMEFITGVISYSVRSWRIVLSKIGAVGTMELQELHSLIQKQIQATVPRNQGSRPMSPLIDICAPCVSNQRRTGHNRLKSISLCTIDLYTDIKLIPVNKLRNLDTVKSRVFVMSPPKARSSSRMPKTSGFHGYENPTLMNTSFDDDPDRDSLHGMLPMYPSPSDDSIFQTSPPGEINKLLSPPVNKFMPSLSPFQPIPNKQMFIASPTKTPNALNMEKNEIKGLLAIGYLLSGSAVEVDDNNGPQIVKSELHVQVTSNDQSSKNSHPLDSKNHLEVIKFILERFEMLSWLNVDAATGRRQSCLPVHVRTNLTTREILQSLTT